ncbi:MAG TPA: ATP-binding protein, partial [Dehalococcoidia bacterium]|nr:ATP-binding protein [Dehalococcoidia bacterium]
MNSRAAWRGSWRGWLWQCALSTAALALVVAVLRPLRLDLGLINVALALLLLSVASAAAWGWVAGLYTSLLSNLAFDYFFVPPLYRLSVQEPAHALALALFLIVAAITAALLAQRRQAAREAQRRAQDTQVLLTLNRTTRDQPLAAIPAAICDWVVRDFPVESCTLYQQADGGLVPVAHAGAGRSAIDLGETAAARRLIAAGVDLDQSQQRNERLPGALLLPLAVEGEAIGVLRVRLGERDLSAEQEALLGAFAGEAAAALHRAALAEAAERATLLQETDRLRSALLSSVSHDLRTPLTAIKTAAGNLRAADVDWSPAARAEFLGAIEAEADRLTRLVTNLLDLSRIEAGALRLELDWNDLEELLREAAYRAERAEAASIPRPIEVSIDRPLPFLRFDYLLIDRVVANLLENALHYSPPGSPVRIVVAAEPGEVRVTVRDQGPGIPPEERERVFTPFYRGAGRGAVGGSGLGLAICRGIVAAHGGRIVVEPSDASGRGAAVSFSLPRTSLGDPFTVFADGGEGSPERSASVADGRRASISDEDFPIGSREASVDRTA